MEPDEAAGSIRKTVLQIRVSKAAEAVEAAPASPIAETKTSTATPIAETKIHYCDECGKGFSSGKALGGHKSSAHVQANKDCSNKKLNSNTREQQQGFGSGDYSCNFCTKVFRSKKSLHGHMRCHPERGWRGMEPPESNSDVDSDCNLKEWQTRIETERGMEAPEYADSDADLDYSLKDWQTRSKRGRRSLNPNAPSTSKEVNVIADLNDERVRVAVEVLANWRIQKTNSIGLMDLNMISEEEDKDERRNY